jgi:hypothetical protein
MPQPTEINKFIFGQPLRLTIDHKQRSAECYCSRVTLDDLLSDEVMAPVLRSAGYEPDEFREMMTEMAWNLVTP